MNNKPNLYICHTAYQLMVALVRSYRDGGFDSLLLSTKIPGGLELWQRIQQTNAIGELIVVNESKWQGLATGPFYHLRNKRAFERNCGWYLERKKYNEIYICNDWSVLGRYLQDCKTDYILCEDTIGSTIKDDQKIVYDQRALTEKQLYLYWGDSPCVKLVESEDADKCSLFPRERMITFSKKALLESLTEEEKAMLLHVFVTEELPEIAEGATLLLPRPFWGDNGGVASQQEQDEMFRAVAEKYCAEPLFVKAHPRDKSDYKALFPEAVVLENTMPSEIMNYCLSFRFKRAVTVESTVTNYLTCADEIICLTLQEALALLH